MQTTNALQTEKSQPGTWGSAFLAGLPHLLIGFLGGVGKIMPASSTSQKISIIFVITLAALVVIMLVIAWRRGWPLWSASWYLYGTWVTVVILGLIIENLGLEESWRYMNAIFIGWILFCVLGYFVILLKSRLHGLLSVSFLFPFLAMTLLEFVPNHIEGWLAIFLGLLAAGLIGAVVRIGEFRSGLTLVLSLNLITGLAIAYVSEYQMLDLPVGITAHIPQFANFLRQSVYYSIFGLGVVSIPLILCWLWNFGKRKLAL